MSCSPAPGENAAGVELLAWQHVSPRAAGGRSIASLVGLGFVAGFAGDAGGLAAAALGLDTHQQIGPRRGGTRLLCVAFAPDGNTLGADTYGERIWVKDLTARKLRCALVHGTDWVDTVCLAPDAKRLASGSREGAVQLWDATRGRMLARFEGHTDWVWSVAFSPDGRTLASGSRDKRVKLWDLSKWTSPPPVEEPAEPPVEEPESDGQEGKEGRETK